MYQSVCKTDVERKAAAEVNASAPSLRNRTPRPGTATHAPRWCSLSLAHPGVTPVLESVESEETAPPQGWGETEEMGNDSQGAKRFSRHCTA